MAEDTNITKEDYFEANFYDTKCICVNSTDEGYTNLDKQVALGYDLLIKFKHSKKRWLIIVYCINKTVNVKIFCENRNGKQLGERSGIIECDHLSDFFKDMI